MPARPLLIAAVLLVAAGRAGRRGGRHRQGLDLRATPRRRDVKGAKPKAVSVVAGGKTYKLLESRGRSGAAKAIAGVAVLCGLDDQGQGPRRRRRRGRCSATVPGTAPPAGGTTPAPPAPTPAPTPAPPQQLFPAAGRAEHRQRGVRGDQGLPGGLALHGLPGGLAELRGRAALLALRRRHALLLPPDADVGLGHQQRSARSSQICGRGVQGGRLVGRRVLPQLVRQHRCSTRGACRQSGRDDRALLGTGARSVVGRAERVRSARCNGCAGRKTARTDLTGHKITSEVN